eukprot:scaffold2934_cov176-Amphora_coffeaeformis.AAC.9
MGGGFTKKDTIHHMVWYGMVPYHISKKREEERSATSEVAKIVSFFGVFFAFEGAEGGKEDAGDTSQH